jgi:uncharacterized membrane protein
MTHNTQELSEKQVGTAPSTGRIEAFSDGVFAIAITILILELGIPELPKTMPKELIAQELGRKLLELWPGKLVAYMLSFVVIGTYWVSHHMVFHHIRHSNRMLLWLNILFLLCVSFIPFPAALLGHYFEQRIAVIIYAATLGFTSLVSQAIWLYASRGRRLVNEDISPDIVSEISRKNLTGALIYACAIAASFVSLPLSIGLLLLAPVLFVLPSRIRRPKGSK